MTAIGELKTLGYEIGIQGDNLKLTYQGKGLPPSDRIKPLLETLKTQKEEVMIYLRENLPKPYLDTDGSVVIPFTSDSRYHWWAGGQSVNKTV